MILFGKIALGIVGTAVAGVGVLCSEGMIEVKVVERQPEVHHVYVIARRGPDSALDADYSRGAGPVARKRRRDAC